MLRITLFGQFSAAHGDQPLRLSLRPKTLELWAYLLLYPHESLPRQAIAFTLWADVDEKTAQTNCRRHLHHLRTALSAIDPDAGWLLADTKTIRWHPDAPAWVDVTVFRSWADDDATLVDAVNLYTGDLLQEVYADWLLHERERDRERYLRALSRLTDLHILSRDYPQALNYAQRLTSSDPLRETSIRQLMRLLYATGDRAGALATYQDFAVRLRRELGVEPMEQTLALFHDIRVNRARAADFVSDDARSVARTRPSPNTDIPFVGRAAELAGLRALWDRVGAGRGHVVLIGGGAGIGKTRLSEALRHIAAGQSAWVLVGGTSFAESVPQQAFIEALSGALPAVVSAIEDGRVLAPLLPFMAELHHLRPDLAEFSAVAQPANRQALFDGFAACFIALSQTRPVLLVLEDLHWASAYTVAMLDHLVRAALHRPLLVVVTYRPEDAPRSHPLRDMLRRLRRERFATLMTIMPLDADAVRAFLSSRLGEIAQADDMVAVFLRLSEGNPLFLHELLRHALEAGWLTQREDGWHLRLSDLQPIPPALETVITERLAHLGANARALAEVAAVIGALFDLELLCEVSGWAEAEVFDALHELLDRGIIREASGQSGFDYGFSHTLIHQTLYGLLDDIDRQRRHRRAAQVMREIYGEAHEGVLLHIARHCEFGGLHGEAAHFYLRAAQRDQRVYAHQEALRHIAKALTLTDDPHLRFDLLALREGIESIEADRTAQLHSIDALAQIAAHDPDLMCEVWLRRVRLMHTAGDTAGLRAAVEGLAHVAQAVTAYRWAAELALARGLYALHTSDYDTAERKCTDALTRFQAIDEPDALLRCRAALTEIALHRGDFDTALAHISTMQTDDPAHIAARLHHLKHAGTHAFVAQRWAVSLEFFEALREGADQYHDPQALMLAHFYLAMNHARLSSFLLAEGHYNQAAGLAARFGSPALKTALHINRGIFRAALGQVRAARRDFEQVQPIVSRAGDKRALYTCAHNLSILSLWTGALAVAQRHAERALTLADAMGSPAFRANALSSLGVIAREGGRYLEAIAHLEEAIALRRQFGGQHTSLLEDLVELTSAYLGTGERTASAHLLAECLARLGEADHATYHFQRVLWLLARLCQDLGDMDMADRLTHEAHVLLQHQLAQLSPAQQEAYLALPFNRAITDAFPR